MRGWDGTKGVEGLVNASAKMVALRDVKDGGMRKEVINMGRHDKDTRCHGVARLCIAWMW